jgi:hypothetical protein
MGFVYYYKSRLPPQEWFYEAVEAVIVYNDCGITMQA